MEAAAEAAAEKSGETEGNTETVVDMEGEAETEVTVMMETATTEMSHWQKVVMLVQAAFREGRLAGEAT